MPGVFAAGNAQIFDGNDENGRPAVFCRARPRFPARRVAVGLRSLLIAYGTWTGFKIVDLGAVAARIDADADKVVGPKAHVICVLRGGDGNARLLAAESNVN